MQLRLLTLARGLGAPRALGVTNDAGIIVRRRAASCGVSARGGARIEAFDVASTLTIPGPRARRNAQGPPPGAARPHGMISAQRRRGAR
jgi:hypothetical protein